jgi:uncharacterized integral membrane protein
MFVVSHKTAACYIALEIACGLLIVILLIIYFTKNLHNVTLTQKCNLENTTSCECYSWHRHK